jgi:hypothetical protein
MQAGKLGSLYMFNIRPAACGGFVGKYGFTKDLERRAQEHARLYRPDPIYLVCSAPIDVRLMREAEEELRYRLRGIHAGPDHFRKYDIPRGREIVLVQWGDLPWVERVYQELVLDFNFKN